MVPLRFVSENLNSDVKWNQSDNSITIVPKGCGIDIPPTTEDPKTPILSDREQIAHVVKAHADAYTNADIAA